MNKLIVSALLLSATVVLAQEKPAPKIAATINGEQITVEDLDRMYRNLPPDMRARYDAEGGKKQFLSQYVGRRLLVQEAIKSAFDKRSDVAGALRDARESALFNLYVSEVVGANVVTDADIRKYYDEHPDEFRVQEMIKARHIIATPTPTQVMNTTGDNAADDNQAQKKIYELLAVVQKDKTAFGALAMRFSEDASAPKGGDLGWFTRGQMVAEFDKAAFETPTGEISPVVKSQFGYHIIFVEEHRPAGRKPYDEVKSDIRERLLAERADRVMTELNSLTFQLRQQSQIQINDENLK